MIPHLFVIKTTPCLVALALAGIVVSEAKENRFNTTQQETLQSSLTLIEAGTSYSLSHSIKQLREALDGASADDVTRELESWAKENTASIETIRLEEAAERLNQSSGSQILSAVSIPPTAMRQALQVDIRNLSVEEHELSLLRNELEASKAKALSVIAAEDQKARRAAIKDWREENELKRARAKELQIAITTSEPSLLDQRQAIVEELAQHNAEFTQYSTEMTTNDRQLAQLSALWMLKKIDFDVAYASVNFKARRNAYRAFLLENDQLIKQLQAHATTLESNNAQAFEETKPGENDLAVLSPNERLRYELRQAWEFGLNRTLSEHPSATQKQRRDLIRSYCMQTQSLQSLLKLNE